jgi:hypothetical protein
VITHDVEGALVLMLLRRDDLSPEELARQEGLDRSWRAAREALAHPEFRAMLEAGIERVRHSTAPVVSAEEFLAATEPAAD